VAAGSSDDSAGDARRDERLARAIAAGAPTALQVSDRFHLRHNRRQVLERVFAQHGVGPGRPAAAPVEPTGPASPSPTAVAQRRQDLGTRIQARVAAGESLRAIAQPLNRDRATVRKYARAATCPVPPSRSPAPRALAGWTDRLEALWQAGEHNGRRLGAAVQAEGCAGSYSAVHRWLVRHHPRSGQGVAPGAPPVSPATRAWPCLQRPTDWSRATAQDLTTALQDATVREAFAWAHRFRAVVKYRRPAAWEPWLRRAETSGLSAFARFAASLRRDQAAVPAAIALPWSQGPVEGFNQTSKRFKRLLYGRARFDLLRARILHAQG
jgi:hypothetical protein